MPDWSLPNECSQQPDMVFASNRGSWEFSESSDNLGRQYNSRVAGGQGLESSKQFKAGSITSSDLGQVTWSLSVSIPFLWNGGMLHKGHMNYSIIHVKCCPQGPPSLSAIMAFIFLNMRKLRPTCKKEGPWPSSEGQNWGSCRFLPTWKKCSFLN